MPDHGHEPISRLSLPRKYLLGIFTAALIVRIMCMVVFQTWEHPNDWQFGYEIGKIGRLLAEGQGFSIGNTPTAKFPPVYAFLVGGIFTVFGVYSTASAVMLFLLQSICAAFTAVCLAILGNRFIGRKEGIIAGFIWIFYPSSLFHSVVRVWYSELAIVLLLFLIVIAAATKPVSIFRRVVCLGLLSGVLTLTSSTMSLYPAVLFLLMLWRWKIGLRTQIRLVFIWCVAAGLVVAPWGIRNYLVMGTPEILKSNLGLELFFGNNPYSTGGGIDEERYQALDALDQEEHNYYRNQPEHIYFGYLKKQAFKWIRQNPFKFLQLSAKRFWFFWGKFPSSGPGPWNRYTGEQVVWYVPIALSALYSILFCIGRRRDLVPIWLFLLIYPLPFYITHVQLYRYRYPVEPFLVLLAAAPLAIWLTRCWRYFKKRPRGT